VDTKSLAQIPGYRYNEYLLILSPHEELWNKIKKIKLEFAEKYRCEQAKWGKPHIALVNFVQFEMLESRLLTRLKTIALGYPPFKVELKDFGSFPSHSIFINVDSKQQVRNLLKALKPAQPLMTLNSDHKPHFIDTPFIPVGRKLLPWQYESGWLEYRHKQFSGRFLADSILLIKRRIGDQPYQIVERFELMNLPVNTKQGELFG